MAVRFVLAEDRMGNLFRFSPLEGELFSSSVSAEQRRALPDSIIVQTSEGVLLARSSAVLHVMRRLGGMWTVFAELGKVVPQTLRDAIYDRVAAVRRRLFGIPETVCPIVPKDLQERFDM